MKLANAICVSDGTLRTLRAPALQNMPARRDDNLFGVAAIAAMQGKAIA